MEPIRPDYAGAWVGGVMPGLLGGPTPEWLPEPARSAERIAMLILDGLGWEALQEHAARMPTMASMAGGPITTVVPSTTAPALTSITTGLAPSEHGVVGYRMRVGGEVLNVLRWAPSTDGSRPDPAAVQPTPPFLGRRVPTVTRAEFAGTGFTEAHLRGATHLGWRTEATLITHCRLLAESGEPFFYAYYDGIDKVAHAHGLLDAFFIDELAAADRLVTAILDVLPSDYALVVTADHGQVHLGTTGWESLDELHHLVAAYAGDGRCRFLHARAGAVAGLLEAARAAFADRAWVFSRDDLIRQGWLGRPPKPTVQSRLGDVILAAKGHRAFIDPGHKRERSLIAGHGSLTSAEMHVPLVAARGRR